LFFDELPEFGRETLEALRQPLENRVISVTRAHGTADYPANFILVATANPCPCGYAGTSRTCDCPQAQINSYRNRVSGPIMDRIDLYSNVTEVDHDRLLTQPPQRESDVAARQRVAGARQMQFQRFTTVTKLNADMSNADIRRLRIDQEAFSILNLAARNLDLSARAYMRTIKVARTIADLESAAAISGSHLAEALNYRPQPAQDKK
jgi:magnesium chelatase family protein